MVCLTNHGDDRNDKVLSKDEGLKLLVNGQLTIGLMVLGQAEELEERYEEHERFVNRLLFFMIIAS